MTFGSRLLASVNLLSAASVVPNQAHAELLCGGRTVQALYYNGVFVSPEGELSVGASTSDPAPLTVAVDYQQGAADTTIHVGDTQITINNFPSDFPFCRANKPGAACTDQIDGFDFKFTGENILGVTTDPATAPNFRPVRHIPRLHAPGSATAQ